MDLYRTDPEFAERFEHFVFDEVIKEENQQLDPSTRYMAILATLMGCGGVEAYREMLSQALENGITPIVAKEIVYQATDYLGYGRMLPFLNVTNEIFVKRMGLKTKKKKELNYNQKSLANTGKRLGKQGISTVGWRQTASVITILEKVLIFPSVNSLPFAFLWHRAAVNHSLLLTQKEI